MGGVKSRGNKGQPGLDDDDAPVDGSGVPLIGSATSDTFQRVTKVRSPRVRRRSQLVAAVSALAVAPLLSACGHTYTGMSPPQATSVPHRVDPIEIVPGPAGLQAGSQPLPTGQMWVLVGTTQSRNLQSINLVTGVAAPIVPISLSANSLAQANSGLLGVGQSAGQTGSLELFNGSTSPLVTTVPLAGPAMSVTAAEDGITFYVLVAVGGSRSVTIVKATPGSAVRNIALPSDATGVLPNPIQSQLYVLETGGTVETVDILSGRPVASFAVGHTPVRMALSNDGSRLYILKSVGSVSDVGVINTVTQSQVSVIPAPADCVDIQLSGDDSLLYQLVGTPAVGNIQAFRLSS